MLHRRDWWSSRHAAIAAIALAALATVLARDWLAGAAVLLLALAFRFLRATEGPPVLFFAFAFQWVQVTIGVFYSGLLGRTLVTHKQSDYRTMVAIGLASLLALLVGLVVGRWIGSRTGRLPSGVPFTFKMEDLVFWYIVSLIAAQGLIAVAWFYPQFTQATLALAKGRYLFLFLLLRKLIVARFQPGLFAAVLFGEILFGFTSYFAGFREGIFLAILAAVERFDYRRRSHWGLVASLGAVLLFCGLLWTGVKGDYRREWHSDAFSKSRAARFERVKDLSFEWISSPLEKKIGTMDALVDRLWAVYYPALAVERVPRDLPHEDGRILAKALRHITTPRFFFPDKKSLVSDSEMVRQYSGVWVAGPEDGVSIAFGYAAESYIDFGIPLMFAPIAMWGCVLGFLYEFFLRAIRRRELAVAFVTLAFWLAFYLFERSWAHTLGHAGMVFIIVGSGTILLDRLLADDASQAPRRRPMTSTGLSEGRFRAPAVGAARAAGRGDSP